jgi:hypothetical protein
MDCVLSASGQLRLFGALAGPAPERRKICGIDKYSNIINPYLTFRKIGHRLAQVGGRNNAASRILAIRINRHA